MFSTLSNSIIPRHLKMLKGDNPGESQTRQQTRICLSLMANSPVNVFKSEPSYIARMKTCVIGDDGRLDISEQDIPAPGHGELVVKMRACGICGTDVEKLHGNYPSRILGHEAVGEKTAQSRRRVVQKYLVVENRHEKEEHDTVYCRLQLHNT